MILTSIHDLGRYSDIHAGFIKAQRFLARTDLSILSEGRHEIDRDDVYAVITSTTGKGKNGTELEAHRDYIDVQFCLSGRDEIGVNPLAQCSFISRNYDPRKDVIFFSDKPGKWITVEGDSCLVLFPEDAHAPAGSTVPMKKIVVKIRAH